MRRYLTGARDCARARSPQRCAGRRCGWACPAAADAPTRQRPRAMRSQHLAHATPAEQHATPAEQSVQTHAGSHPHGSNRRSCPQQQRPAPLKSPCRRRARLAAQSQSHPAPPQPLQTPSPTEGDPALSLSELDIHRLNCGRLRQPNRWGAIHVRRRPEKGKENEESGCPWGFPGRLTGAAGSAKQGGLSSPGGTIEGGQGSSPEAPPSSGTLPSEEDRRQNTETANNESGTSTDSDDDSPAVTSDADQAKTKEQEMEESGEELAG